VVSVIAVARWASKVVGLNVVAGENACRDVSFESMICWVSGGRGGAVTEYLGGASLPVMSIDPVPSGQDQYPQKAKPATPARTPLTFTIVRRCTTVVLP
jgi:hypothetical protein